MNAYIINIYTCKYYRGKLLIFSTFGQDTYKSVKIISLVSVWPIKGTVDS